MAYAPAAVTAAGPVDIETLVSWLPGAEAAEIYHVYGITDEGTPVLLAQSTATDAPNAWVPTGFSTYAVAGVKAGIESDLVFALTKPCVVIDLPTIGIDDDCLEKLNGDAKIRHP